MKIYLAGASSEIEVVRHFRDRVRSAGHTITHDWIADVEAAIARGKSDRDLTREEAEYHARQDAGGAMLCDVFWLLVPANPKSSIGCWVELGAAFGNANGYGGAPRIIISGDTRASIFCSLANELYESHEAAFASLVAGEASKLLCPCQGPNDDPGPHVDGCPWQDPNYDGGGTSLGGAA